MVKPVHEMSSWSPTAASRPPLEEAWEATREAVAATQLVGDREAYLAESARAIGRRVGEGQWEMFVVCAPGEALQLELAHVKPVYLAVHDVGTTASRRLVAGIAAAAGSRLQKLTIRRQGYGVPLATLEFVELGGGAQPLRVYTTEADADMQARHDLARVLLGHATLAVALVGDLPPHALATALAPLKQAMDAGPWPNRHFLMLPLSAAGALSGQAGQMGHAAGVSVRTTPPVRRPAEAWAYINATWNKLREEAAAGGGALAPLATHGPGAAPASGDGGRLPAATAPGTAAAPAGADGARDDTASPVVAAAVPSAASGALPLQMASTPAAPTASPVQPAAWVGRGVPSAPSRAPAPARGVDGATMHGKAAAAPGAAAFPAAARAAGGFMPSPPPASAAPFERLSLDPMPEPVASAATAPDGPALREYAKRCVQIKGMVSCCVFEPETQRSLAHAGGRPGPAMLASQGAELLAALQQSARAMGLGEAAPDVAITLPHHHLLLRPVPHHPGCVLHAVLDGGANLMLARLQLQRLDETLAPAG